MYSTKVLIVFQRYLDCLSTLFTNNNFHWEKRLETRHIILCNLEIQDFVSRHIPESGNNGHSVIRVGWENLPISNCDASDSILPKKSIFLSGSFKLSVFEIRYQNSINNKNIGTLNFTPTIAKVIQKQSQAISRRHSHSIPTILSLFYKLSKNGKQIRIAYEPGLKFGILETIKKVIEFGTAFVNVIFYINENLQF